MEKERLAELATQARRGMVAVLVLSVINQEDTPKFQLIVRAVARAAELLAENGVDIQQVFDAAQRDADGILAEAMTIALIKRGQQAARDGTRVEFPLLAARLADGRIKLDRETYVGMAADGKEVSLGGKGWEPTIEIYLRSHPEPKDW